ncbi:sugar transferase [Jeotgalibacillus proteolyticus]|uniref:Sugar transferase n=1 Tax=Jeotgalibacillus proteolyticus TaxID=2082395 RepID=A0A2S5G8C5_9BACL|nr:sugar transferase [Jeotgalibacillus proteolyticus]PPA69236.1 sugar transferase [Jeotgalibacillus proteolyticus]
MKRFIDVFLSLLLFIILFPIMVIVAMIVLVKMGKPVLFTQQRPGLHGKPFYLIKFRTMKNSVDKNGVLLSDEERLTATGRFLRKFSLDELPQLLNVIRGDMSLVGPRPLLMEYLPLYSEDQFTRHHVRPGITGWAQINGRNAIRWEEKFEMDAWYVKNHSLLVDIKILFITVKKVFKKEGVTQRNHATMEKFTGSKGVS